MRHEQISPERARTFIAGGLALIFFKGFVQGICEVIAGAIAGTFLWRVLVGTIVVSGLGLALAIAFLAGRRWAVSLVRLFLILLVAGDCLYLIMPLLHINTGMHIEVWKSAADIIVDSTFLVLVIWSKPPTVADARAASTAPSPPATAP